MVLRFVQREKKTAAGQIVATDRGVEGVSDLAVVSRRASLGLGLPRHVIDLEVVHALRRHPTRVVFLVAFHAKPAATRRDVQHAISVGKRSAGEKDHLQDVTMLHVGTSVHVKGSAGEKDRLQAVWLTCR